MLIKSSFLLFFFIYVGVLVAQPIDTTYQSDSPESQNPTYANVIGPENILVIFKDNDSVSIAIKDYYVQKRNIPSSNILGLDLPDTASYNGERVILWQEGEVIKRDDICSDYLSNGVCDTLAWHYYVQYIANPVSNFLNSTINSVTGHYLKDDIYYVVLTKNIPLKLKSADESWYRINCNISLDGLLCLIKTDNNENPSIMKLYAVPPFYTNTCWISNPYFAADLNFNFNDRFKPNHYSINKILNDNTSAQFKISCLVSRLDGRNLEDVISMIDKSCNPDKSGACKWIIDGHYYYSWETQYWQGYNNYTINNLIATANKLTQYGFNVYCDSLSRNPIYNNNDNSYVIGYCSWGVHSGMPTTYYDSLNFSLANGSISNTIESYNCYSMDPNIRRDGHGLVSDFIHIGGTSGVGHTWEPFLGPNNNSYDVFPAYAMGYNIVEAAYQGISELAWQNIVVGDPLSTIAWGKQSTRQSTTLEGVNLVTDTITISIGDTLIFASGSVIKLKHNGFVKSNGFGVLTVGSNVTVTSDSWSRGLLLADNHDHPQLVWSDYPTGPSNYYKIYKKLNSGSWQYVDSVRTHSWIDNSLTFSDAEGQYPTRVYYYVKLNGTNTSNTVDADVNKSRGKIIPPAANQMTYKLEQNYPNPFNPTTTINYSIKSDGFVSLKVYNILGQQVADLVNQNQRAGYYNVNFNAFNLPSGVYIYTIKTSGFTSSKKMLLIK